PLSFLLTLAAGAAVISPFTPTPGVNGAPEDPNAAAIAAPPKTAVNEVKEMVQGTEIVDPYRWLEEQNSPETRAWIDAQNAYTDSMIAKFAGRDAVRQQVSALIKIDTMSAPVVTNNRYFFS